MQKTPLEVHATRLDNTSKLQYYEYNNIDVIPQKRTSMNIHDYVTAGGKNLIKEYISTRPMDERREIRGLQKGKAEKFELETALKRAKESNLI
jgi:hypothetical protein